MIVTGRFPVWFFYMAGPLLGGALAALAFRVIGKADAPTMSLEGLEGAPVELHHDEPPARSATARAGSAVGLVEDVTEQLHGAISQAVEQGIEHAKSVVRSAVRDLRGFASEKPVIAATSAMGVGAIIGFVLRLGRRQTR